MSDVPKDTPPPADSSPPQPAPEKLSSKGITAIQGASDSVVHSADAPDNASDVTLNRKAISQEEVEETLGRKSLWTDDTGKPIEPKGKEGRGVDYERLKGANIGGTFETIDDYNPDARTATSYKSIDLNAKTYEDNPAASKDIIKGYIRRFPK